MNILKRTGNAFLWKIAVCVIPVLLTSSSAFSEERRERLIFDKNLPIQIVSDRLDAFSEKRVVVFSGNATATQGDRVIKSDHLYLFYRNRSQEKTERDADQQFGKKGDLQRIEAKGKVSITEGSRIVTGNEAIYYQDDQKIVMTGNAVMREGDNTIRGDRIIVLLNENRGIVESDPNKRVTATIYPKDSRVKK
ncbi:MAG: lipopolysaccharide transport periplasmic protein LptA [Deltaproteobacteria bacterium]|nr:lipopolysaccharide transport periplasmic protein LptA [Deltaproteobacteria bacterium]